MSRLTAIPATTETPLARLVDDYLASCRARGLSPKTVKDAYGYPLQQVFLPFCERQGIGGIEDLDNRLMDRYSSELLERGGKRGPLSRHSVHAYVRNVNLFLGWARRQGETVDAKGQLPKLARRDIDVLSRDEVAAMEAAAPTERDKLIIRVLADTGMRVGELVGLQPADIIERNRNHFLRITHAKGGDNRLAPIMPDLARRLRRYADRGRPSDSPDRLFVALRRSPNGRIAPLETSGVLQMIRDIAERAQVAKRVYPHLFRHSFITEALRRGMNPLMVAKIVGHTSLVMIQRNYEHLVVDDTYDALSRMLREK
ncbi:MAG: tyrosine-type recombinase/integrase [Candidatus Dormibacter sp.]